MEGNKVTLDVRCNHCNQIYKIKVDLDNLYAWQNGDKLVQEAFPYLTPEERELLLTHTCPTCWDNMFGQFD